ncbi:MAG TPA: hypothetical protein VIY48_04655 [Candidatus Paceibacterota bacterium]
MTTDYQKFRGKCKELVDAVIASDPSLTAVRGHYFCPIWNTEEPHWWATTPDGKIVDPSAKQFPSKGNGMYTPFNGLVPCAECGAEMKEDEVARTEGRYGFCSTKCAMRFVGL